MKVFVRFLGLLRDYLGEQQLSIELAENATLRDLFTAVGERWSAQLPKGFLQAGTMAMVNGKATPDLETRLQEQQEVLLLRVSVGG